MSFLLCVFVFSLLCFSHLCLRVCSGNVCAVPDDQSLLLKRIE